MTEFPDHDPDILYFCRAIESLDPRCHFQTFSKVNYTLVHKKILGPGDLNPRLLTPTLRTKKFGIMMLSTNDQHVYSAVGGLSHGSSSRVVSRTHTDVAQREVMKPEQLQHIWIITGPTGSGKSTVAKYLKQELKLPFLEGDDVSACLLEASRQEKKKTNMFLEKIMYR